MDRRLGRPGCWLDADRLAAAPPWMPTDGWPGASPSRTGLRRRRPADVRRYSCDPADSAVAL